MLYKAKYRGACKECLNLVTEFEKENELSIIIAKHVRDFYKYTNKKAQSL